MYISTKLSNSKIIENIKIHLLVFTNFDNIYLFGSILDEHATPNDIDILLIYRSYSDKIVSEFDKVQNFFDVNSSINFDYTLLSEKEEKNVNFLNRLDSKFIKLK